MEKQYITNIHDVCVSFKSPTVFYSDTTNIILSYHIVQYTYRVSAIKQAIFEKGRKVDNALVSLLLAGL